MKISAERWLKAHIKVSGQKSCVRAFSADQLKAIAAYMDEYHRQSSDPEQMERILEKYEAKPEATP